MDMKLIGIGFLVSLLLLPCFGIYSFLTMIIAVPYAISSNSNYNKGYCNVCGKELRTPKERDTGYCDNCEIEDSAIVMIDENI